MRNKQYVLAAIIIIITAIVPLSTHVLIIQYFHAPALKITSFINMIAGLTICFGMIIASMFIYACSKSYWESVASLNRVILFAVLLMALNEQLFRSLIMNILVGIPLKYEILSSIPNYINYLMISLAICLFMEMLMTAKRFKCLKYLLFIVIVTMLSIFINKFSHHAIAPLLNTVSQPGNDVIQLPYGLKILIPAYITFLEPTIATFVVFYLIKEKLSTFNTLTKGLIMGGIIIAIHSGLYSLVQILSSQGDLFYRIFYYGQFLWEYLVLGVLTAYFYMNWIENLGEKR